MHQAIGRFFAALESRGVSCGSLKPEDLDPRPVPQEQIESVVNRFLMPGHLCVQEIEGCLAAGMVPVSIENQRWTGNSRVNVLFFAKLKPGVILPPRPKDAFWTVVEVFLTALTETLKAARPKNA